MVRIKPDRLHGLTLEQMQVLADRLRKVGAQSFETDLARPILDDVESCMDAGNADSVTTIAQTITWPKSFDRKYDLAYRARLVRIALAVLGASYDRRSYTFLWKADLTIDAK